MDPVSITIGLSWCISGLLLMVLSVPLARGKVGRNFVYGVRFPQSFQSDDAWHAINRFGGRRMILWSVPIIAVGVVSFFIPLESRTTLSLLLGFGPMAFVVIPAIESWRFAQRYIPRM